MINMMYTEEQKKQIADENRKLCERFPFLVPWNRFSGKLITECMNGEKGYFPGNPDDIPEYDWSYTELDDLPSGWRKAFGLQMCEEIRDALIEDGDLNRWRMVQVKEKYGSARIYDNGHKRDSRIPDIIDKYERMSERICIVCGRPATRITTGWICPYCDDCCPDIQWIPAAEYFGEDEGKNGSDDHGN